ncbi:MAG TPA: TolC family protein [Acidobacteriaceae bacterium]
MKPIAAIVLPALALVTGCAPYKYHPAPISPPALAHSLQARSLDDPDFLSWMKEAAHYEPKSWPLRSWDFEALTLAAWYFNPEMDVARANAAAADAAIKTAAMKPNPSAGAGAGYETTPESPFLMTLDFSLPIETAGKRGYRIATATHLSEASRIQVAETAWAVRSRVRAALVDYVFAVSTAGVLRTHESLQSRYVELLEARFRAGEIPLPEVTAARVDLINLRQALRAAEGQTRTTHAVLAAAVGIPDTVLSGKNVIWSGTEQPPLPASLPPEGVRESAVLNRLDVQRVLAQYEAAQSNLQLEVARQYPDINLGPGYGFEEGYHLASLGLAAVLPIRNHNEGPIAEAEAQRKVAGTQLLAIQSTVIADTDKALARYVAAHATLEEAEYSVHQLETQRKAAYQSLQSGETDQLAALSSDIQISTAIRARLDALHEAQLSLGSLEDALQRPIDPSTMSTSPERPPR